jgi:hypothetical protein
MGLFAPFFVGLYLSHVYRRWSRLYRWLWERKYNLVPLKSFTTFLDLARYLRTMVWVADGPLQLWDAISTPQAVQWRVDNREKKDVGDCDEFAIYISNVISTAMAQGKFADPHLVEVCFLTVTWMVPSTGETGGHNVCGLKWKYPNYEAYGYMDYGMPISSCFSWEEVAEAVRVRYTSAKDVVSLGWSRHTPNLDFIEAGK